MILYFTDPVGFLMASSFAWLSVSLKQELEVLKGRTVVKVSWEESFGASVQKVGSEWVQEIVLKS